MGIVIGMDASPEPEPKPAPFLWWSGGRYSRADSGEFHCSLIGDCEKHECCKSLLGQLSLENAIAVSVLRSTYVGGTVVNSCYNYVENIWYQFETPNLIHLIIIRGKYVPWKS